MSTRHIGGYIFFFFPPSYPYPYPYPLCSLLLLARYEHAITVVAVESEQW